jgi:DNA-directed RNA polymerase subunit RPC12/RpoP
MVDHERQLMRLARKHLTRCPYCAKDYTDIPYPKVKQFRCLGCSAFISLDMLVEELDDEVFDRDTENVCTACGFHWPEDLIPPTTCPGCSQENARADLITEREFAAKHANFVSAGPIPNQGGNGVRGCVILAAALFALLLLQGLIFKGCAG